MTFRYDPALHVYTVDSVPIPSLTQMLAMDGCSEHLNEVPRKTLEAKREWGTALHTALQKVEYGFGITEGFQPHCVQWLETCERMKWGVNHMPIWKNCEMPALAEVEGLFFGFTPDRSAPEAIVEIKGTYSPHYSHGIQTALQVIGMGYDRKTPRYVAYFGKEGLKRLHQCGSEILRDGQKLDVFAEAERIIFEHAAALEAA